jgi:hypothetical protein
MFGKQLRTRYARTVMIGLLGVLIGACVFGLPALASTTHPNAHSRHHQGARAAGRIKGPGDTQAADSRLQAAVKAALDGLVTNGTINQHQEDVIEAQVIAGSVDPQQLVSGGVISASQMSAVNNALIQVKQSFAASTGGAADKTTSPGGGDNTGGSDSTKSSDATTRAADARLQAAAKAALDGLVTNGTINQHQADVIEAQVIAGSVDPQQLVSSGVISASQMSAVNNALIQVKQSFANG